MISFNNKYLTIAAILLLFYLIYDASKNTPRNKFFEHDKSNHKIESKYTITIDPSKPEKDRSMVENWILNKYVPNKSTQTSTQTAISENGVKTGDLIKINYKDLTTYKSEVINLKVGENKLPKIVENELLGMNLGITKVMNLADDNGKKIYIEVTILAIERLPTENKE
jgi:hypothetical protein